MQKSLVICAVIVFTGLCFLYGSAAQNCAIPQHVSLPLDDNILTECAEVGTVLTSLTIKNLQSFKNIIVTPSNFIRVELDGNGTLSLIVDHPLYQPIGNETFSKTYIDETWSQSIHAQLQLGCDDGRSKTVEFTIPIADRNSQPPVFSSPGYNLTMGPCYNGTHGQACPLNFETPILVSDADRDFLNADMNFTTDRPELIRISSSIVQISPRSTDLSPNNFVRNIRLYLQESDYFNVGEIFEFTLVAYNNGSLSPLGERLSASALITIRFGHMSDGENSTVLKPPTFSSKAYYAVVDSLFQSQPGTELDSIKPSSVSAYSTSIDEFLYGYGPDPEVGEDANLKVRYEISESDIFKIDPVTGKLYFSENATELLSKPGISPERLYEITAFFETYKFLPARVPLLVFFSLASTITTDPPVCATCPDCSSSPDCPSTETTCGEMTTPYLNVTQGPTTESPTTFPPQTTTNPNTTTTITSAPTTTTNSTTTLPSITTITTTPTPTTTLITDPVPSTQPPIPTSEIPTSTQPPIPTSEIPTSTQPPIPTSEIPTSTQPPIPTSEIPTSTQPPIPTSEIPTSTQPPIPTSEIPTSTQPPIPISEIPTSTQPPIPTSEIPTSTQPPIPTSEIPTSTQPPIPTSEIPTSTQPPIPTSEVPISTGSPTTTSTWSTTLITLTSMAPTSTESPPAEEDCCKKCRIVKDFECPSNNPDPSLRFPDPHDCKVYHKCIADEISPMSDFTTHLCPDGQVFCPEQQNCVIPSACICTGFNPIKDCPDNSTEGCETCDSYPVDDPNNVCNRFQGEIPQSRLIPDPIYNDIFHSCQKDEWADAYVDSVMHCPPNTIFCKDLGQCGWPNTDICKNTNEGKVPYKCNPCHNYYLNKGVHLSYL